METPTLWRCFCRAQFTMEGPPQGFETNVGIGYKAVQQLFNIAHERAHQLECVPMLRKRTCGMAALTRVTVVVSRLRCQVRAVGVVHGDLQRDDS
jgi:hypothetical protein